MTPDQITGLTDEQLIERVAVEVMGWEPTGLTDKFGRRKYRHHGKRNCLIEVAFRPLTDWSHTMQVVERFTDQGWDFGLTTNPSPWTASFCKRNKPECLVNLPVPQLAICLAVLSACESQ